MLAGQTRIPAVEVETLPVDMRMTLEEQRKTWGEPLYPYLFYARNPAYFRAAKAMWDALQDNAKRVPRTLGALINRRVAWWNRCEYCQDAHAAKSKRFGVSTEKIEALNEYARSPLFSAAEKVALEYADVITDTHRDVDDELFKRLQQHYDDDAIAELTMMIAWQNASSRFNHAFHIPSQKFWKR
ncbi:MAG TPA: carboxymuconolactone decarboxylase family protein [Rhodoblastus sp.]|nr:carboxymuconolactone decarboxylase family protein [Rhodoblastus sp.]